MKIFSPTSEIINSVPDFFRSANVCFWYLEIYRRGNQKMEDRENRKRETLLPPEANNRVIITTKIILL